MRVHYDDTLLISFELKSFIEHLLDPFLILLPVFELLQFHPFFYMDISVELSFSYQAFEYYRSSSYVQELYNVLLVQKSLYQKSKTKRHIAFAYYLVRDTLF
jgi:hypothetical protein